MHRCHKCDGGATKACCKNMTQPDKLTNEHGFDKKYVDAAYKLINKWFFDEDLQSMCRVIKMGGSKKDLQVIEPVMYYTWMDGNGATIWESSTLSEVKMWMLADKTNL